MNNTDKQMLYVKVKPSKYTLFNRNTNRYIIPYEYGEYVGFKKCDDGIYRGYLFSRFSELILDKKCKYISFVVDSSEGKMYSEAKVTEIQSRPFDTKSNKYKELIHEYKKLKTDMDNVKKKIKEL